MNLTGVSAGLNTPRNSDHTGVSIQAAKASQVAYPLVKPCDRSGQKIHLLQDTQRGGNYGSQVALVMATIVLQDNMASLGPPPDTRLPSRLSPTARGSDGGLTVSPVFWSS